MGACQLKLAMTHNTFVQADDPWFMMFNGIKQFINDKPAHMHVLIIITLRM